MLLDIFKIYNYSSFSGDASRYIQLMFFNIIDFNDSIFVALFVITVIFLEYLRLEKRNNAYLFIYEGADWKYN